MGETEYVLNYISKLVYSDGAVSAATNSISNSDETLAKENERCIFFC